jgi:2-C-methyl-D-erythritol 4-phosphate cytidylyltransferase
MTPKVAALVPAAGEGARLAQGPKAFLEVGGKALLERAVEAFAGQVDEIVVAVPANLVAEAERKLAGRARVIAGGARRQESVFRLLQATEADIVLIHDAARPFLDPKVIAAVLRAVAHTGAASAVLPVADTLIEANTGAAVDREGLRAVQTPQGFYRGLVQGAHENALDSGLSATDDAGLVRAAGQPVVLVEGSAWLMKITTPADLEIARALAPTWDEKADRDTP